MKRKPKDPSKPKKPKKKPPYNQNSAIRSALRRAFSRSPLVTEVLNDSRREVPRYKKDGTLAKRPYVRRQCQVCGEWVGSTKISVDHIDPVIPSDGTFEDWNTYVDRLWCNKIGKANLQRICDACHDKKTQTERDSRKQAKDKKDGKVRSKPRQSAGQ